MSTGFPKMKLSGAGTFKPPTKTKLSKESKPGDYVSWTIDARTYEGNAGSYGKVKG